MLTRDQEYAMEAHKRVTTISELYKEDEKNRRKYGATAHKLPLLIRAAGLAQALVFVETRSKDADNPYKRLLRDLENTISKDVQKPLAERARSANLSEYMLLTQQALDALLWYKRFAQSILGVDASASIEDGENANA